MYVCQCFYARVCVLTPPLLVPLLLRAAVNHDFADFSFPTTTTTPVSSPGRATLFTENGFFPYDKNRNMFIYVQLSPHIILSFFHSLFFPFSLSSSSYTI